MNAQGDTGDAGTSGTKAVGALDQLIQERFGGKRHLWIPGLLAIVTFFDSWDIIAISLVAPALIRSWGVSPLEIGVLVSAGYFGQFVGAIALGSLADRYGRIPVLSFAAALMAILGGGAALASNVPVLVLIRFIQGIGIGGAMPVCIAYLNEIAPARSRGSYIITFQFITTAGFVVAPLASIAIIPHFGWRWMFAAGLIPLAVLPWIMLKIPESPRWLLRSGKREEACRILDPSGGRWAELMALLDAELRPVEEATSQRSSVRSLLGRQFRRKTFAIWTIWLLTAIVSYGLLNWIPTLYTTIYRLPLAQALQYSSIPTTIYAVIPIFVALLIDRLGRRKLAILGVSISALAFILFLLAGTNSVTGFMLFTIFALNGVTVCQLVSWAYTGEIYPTTHRSLALGWASSWARAASAVTPLIVGQLLSLTSDMSLVMLWFLGCTIVVILTWWFFCEETRGRVLD
jgi:putative MFS transporter